MRTFVQKANPLTVVEGKKPDVPAHTEPVVKRSRESFRFGHDFNAIPVRGNSPGLIQTKLTMSTPGDHTEQEADRVAEEVMRKPNQQAGGSQEASRLSAGIELQGKGTGSDTEEVEGRIASGIRALEGSGERLSEPSRAFFEPRLGHDFTAVRIHTDSRAEGLARSVNARAFTLGQDIVFGSGEYSPESEEGKHLLSHELAHVVQQQRAEPYIQRLTITQHALTKGTCDGRNVQWVFSLDSAAAEDGYIVQQVNRNEYVETCPDLAYGPPGPLPTFWEAWFVKKGDKVDWTTTRDKWTDGSTHAPRPDTNGFYIATGAVKFFTTKTTGDLGDYGKAPADPTSPWGPGKVPISGALPSTPTEPSWWSGAPVEGPANRGVWSSWNCCDADKTKHSYELTAKPKP